MAYPIQIGTLLKELVAIVWTYVGADLSVFIRKYQEYKNNPALFRDIVRGETNMAPWYDMAAKCAAFYGNGYRWIKTLPLGIYWEIPVCFAITQGNLSHLRRRANISTRVFPVPFTETFDFAPEHMEHFADRRALYLISALHAERDPDKIFSRVCNRLLLDGNITQKFGSLDMGALCVYAAAKNFLGNGVPEKFCGTDSLKAFERMFRAAIAMKNSSAAYNILKKMNVNILSATARNDIMYNATQERFFSPDVARVLYDHGLLNNGPYLSSCLYLLRDRNVVFEQFKFFARRIGFEPAIGLFQGCFYINGHECRKGADRWFNSVVQNGDSFWAELGLE